MSIGILIVVYAVPTILESIALNKKNKMKELIIFLSFMLIAFVLSILISQGVKVPSIDMLVGDWLLPILGD